ncbi:MAG TPA: hypothetical protein H9717_10480 [Candidatus Eisenbergiella merdipullorum]|uniref:Uncharacterized protein n=1 Tax=Candidatus Eisenbergiella merdipullorum TaxID=2838553 RepID=A0A9D2I725_9FIRM|nr:hypothetical protein [Candidatus Eisenbergiella merdipullorum]
MNEKKESFHYSYSAEQQKEIQKIREKYVPKEENKMEQLRRLDKSATKPGTAAAITAGVMGALLLGIGMCCTMVWMDALFLPGILIGIAGIAAIICAPLLYRRITKKKREKLAPEILKLTDELSRQQ